MSFYAISALVNVVTSLVLGFLILLADKRSRLNQTFAAFAFFVAFWSYAYFLWQIATDAESALYLTHLLIAGAIFITPVYFHFVTYLLNKTERYEKFIVAGYLFTAISFSVSWTDLFITKVTPLAGFNFWPIAGPLFLPFLVGWVFYAILPVYLLFKDIRETGYKSASTSAIVFAGTIIGYVGGCTNYFLWYGIPVLPYGNISASIYLSLVAYAIMRNKLFNMKVIATELLIFALWLFIFVRLLLSESVSEQIADAGLLLVSLIVGALLIRSVDREVEQRELIQAQEKALETVNAQQENLLHFISHEIKGYLTKSEAVFASVVEGDFGAVPPKLAEVAQTALVDVRKGVSTVMDILDASNLKKGTMSFKKLPMDFRVLVVKIVEEQRPIATEKHLAFDLKIADGVYKMEGDEEKLREHVIRNLIDNAIKYTPQGTVRIELSDGGGKIRFMVQDSGVGITPEDMARLFTEGGHGKDSIKVNVHSTGYGLFIAKQIVDAHGGKIWAETDGPGKGARFIVEFTA